MAGRCQEFVKAGRLERIAAGQRFGKLRIGVRIGPGHLHLDPGESIALGIEDAADDATRAASRSLGARHPIAKFGRRRQRQVDGGAAPAIERHRCGGGRASLDLVRAGGKLTEAEARLAQHRLAGDDVRRAAAQRQQLDLFPDLRPVVAQHLAEDG